MVCIWMALARNVVCRVCFLYQKKKLSVFYLKKEKCSFDNRPFRFGSLSPDAILHQWNLKIVIKFADIFFFFYVEIEFRSGSSRHRGCWNLRLEHAYTTWGLFLGLVVAPEPRRLNKRDRRRFVRSRACRRGRHRWLGARGGVEGTVASCALPSRIRGPRSADDKGLHVRLSRSVISRDRDGGQHVKRCDDTMFFQSNRGLRGGNRWAKQKYDSRGTKDVVDQTWWSYFDLLASRLSHVVEKCKRHVSWSWLLSLTYDNGAYDLLISSCVLITFQSENRRLSSVFVVFWTWVIKISSVFRFKRFRLSAHTTDTDRVDAKTKYHVIIGPKVLFVSFHQIPRSRRLPDENKNDTTKENVRFMSVLYDSSSHLVYKLSSFETLPVRLIFRSR